MNCITLHLHSVLFCWPWHLQQYWPLNIKLQTFHCCIKNTMCSIMYFIVFILKIWLHLTDRGTLEFTAPNFYHEMIKIDFTIMLDFSIKSLPKSILFVNNICPLFISVTLMKQIGDMKNTDEQDCFYFVFLPLFSPAWKELLIVRNVKR